MNGISREGDLAEGTCYSHDTPIHVTGTLTSSQYVVSCDGKRVTLINDDVNFSCGHTGIVQSGSIVTKVLGKGIARVGSPVIGKDATIDAVVITGSSVSDIK